MRRSYIMNVKYAVLLTCALLFGLILHSCISDDFTDTPGTPISFSSPTVDFGTVFTGDTSPTARLVVANHNKKGLRISSIRFRNADSPFSFNVDGVSGNEFKDVEINGNDSIYIFLECRIMPDNSDQPRIVTDELDFTVNGEVSSVEVEATAVNVERLSDITLTADTQFTPQRPYVIFGTLTVGTGATLTVEPGTQLLFHAGASMRVEGNLQAIGTPDQKIDIRGDRLDDVLPDVAYDIMAGQWKGISISAQSYGNRLECVDMRSTEEGLRVDSCGNLARQKLTLVNSWLHNSRTTVLESKYAKVDAYGCCFSEAAGAVVSLTGGEHLFTQCTIANNYLFSMIGGANLSLYHCLPEHADENDNPLMKASFENGIIWGIGEPLNEGDLKGSDVFFRNVLLKADGDDDDWFENCIWNEDPLFLTIRNDYYFNYHVKPDSPALGAGNPIYVTPQCLFDMDGADRLATGAPTLGAYALPETPEYPQ
ncbi:MAG: hypothetical protein K2J48_04305 [Muribaculaceae bacterium]|nr:hypothetical protein [Muribaculaceae bacterium]